MLIAIDVPTDKIITALAEINLPVESVAQIHSYNKDKTKLPLYLATFKNTDELQNITQVQYLLSYKIKIENYISYPRPTKGFKCQKFHHVSKHCHLDPKCVKCAGSHPYQQCKNLKEEDHKCVNCGEKHTAN